VVTLSRLHPTAGQVDDIHDAYPWPAGRWVRASMVATVDGAGVGPDGRSGSISTPADFELFVALRNSCDVIVVGAGTARAEGYRPPRSARLAVVTRSARLDPTLPFIADAPEGAPPIVLTCATADRAALEGRAEVVVCGDDRVDLGAALEALESRGLRHVVVEGGPSLLGDLLAADLVDEVDLQVTPLLAGGGAARVVSGGALPHPPAHLHLAHVLTDGATLFLRYTRATTPHPTRAGA